MYQDSDQLPENMGIGRGVEERECGLSAAARGSSTGMHVQAGTYRWCNARGDQRGI